MSNRNKRESLPLGGKVWRKNGGLHANGYEKWFRGTEYHRIDGPAEIYPDGTELYYKYGRLVFRPRSNSDKISRIKAKTDTNNTTHSKPDRGC